jgi:hypothetical protein
MHSLLKHPTFKLPALQLVVGDMLPVVPAAAGSAAELQRPVLARVTAIERLVDVGVFMPHTLTGAPALFYVCQVAAQWWLAAAAFQATCSQRILSNSLHSPAAL